MVNKLLDAELFYSEDTNSAQNITQICSSESLLLLNFISFVKTTLIIFWTVDIVGDNIAHFPV